VNSRLDTLEAGARHTARPYLYPIAQLARSTRTRFQIGFARMTMHLFPELQEAALEASADGLKILAANEMALAHPREVIRQIHGDDVAFGEPEVQLLYAEQVHEPIMWVRAAVDRDRMEDAVQALVGRGAAIEELDWVAPVPVVRARGPLRRLIGYPQLLSALTQGSADLQMWLSHYEPMPPEPEKAA
jgi:predicted membrane GTPase involved in stress response